MRVVYFSKIKNQSQKIIVQKTGVVFGNIAHQFGPICFFEELATCIAGFQQVVRKLGLEANIILTLI